MITEHALPKSLCRRGQPLRVLIVGAGGNGSAVLLGLPYLHQAMKVWGHAGGHPRDAGGRGSGYSKPTASASRLPRPMSD